MQTGNVNDVLPTISVVSDEYNRDPHEVIARARALGSIARSERGWEVFRYETARMALRDDRLQTPDAEHALARGATDLIASFVRDGLLLDMVPERHQRVRRVMMGAFALRRIDERKDVMQAVANDLLDALEGRTSCSFIADFSHQYSVRVLCSLLGVDDEDIPEFSQATTQLRLMSSIPLEPVLPRIDAALQTLWDYSKSLVERRTRQPRGDFISGLIEAQKSEGKLSESELIWGIANLLFAGHETTRNQLAMAMRAMAEHPDAWNALREGPETIKRVLHEAIRYYPVLFSLRRVVQVPVTYDGIDFAVGDNVSVNYLAISRDPEHFDRPNTFDWTRDAESFAVNFGFGPHLCVGKALAQAEMIEALAVLRARWKNISIEGPLKHTPFSNALGGLEELPMSFECI